MAFVSILRDVILSVLVLIALTVLFLIFILPLSVLLLFRWTVSKMSKLFKPELYKILPPLSAIYLQHEIENEERGNIITTTKFDGVKFNKDEILSRMLNLFEPGNGQPAYPELKMYTFYWMGYGFWKLEENFQIEEHFFGPIVINEDEDEDDFISRCETNCLKTPFSAGKSPWEVILIEGRSNAYIIFKCHHSLGDGSTFIRVWSKLMDNKLSVYYPEFSMNWIIKLWIFSTFPFMAAFDIVKMIPHILAPPNPWEMMVKDMSENTRIIFKSRELILCEEIKQIRKTNRVSFTAVLLSAISGGIRNVLETQGKVCPEFMTVTNLVPLPGHSDRMTNHFASCPLNLPVGEVDNVKRLQLCETELVKSKTSKLPIIATQLSKLLGSLPHCVLAQLSPAKYVPPIQISNLAGPNTVMEMFGHPILDVTFNIRVGRTLPVLLTILSYNGQIRISANVDPGIFPNENSLQQFVTKIQCELKS